MKLKNSIFFMLIFLSINTFSSFLTGADQEVTRDLNQTIISIIFMLQIACTIVGLIILVSSYVNDFRGQEPDITNMIRKTFQTVTILSIVWGVPDLILNVFGSTINEMILTP